MLGTVISHVGDLSYLALFLGSHCEPGLASSEEEQREETLQPQHSHMDSYHSFIPAPNHVGGDKITCVFESVKVTESETPAFPLKQED